MDKVACMIDAGYLQKVLSGFGKPRIDYQSLVAAMTNSKELLRTYYYDCKVYMSNPPTSEERERQAKQEGFHKYLQALPQFECRFGRLEKRWNEDGSCIFEQKRVDVMLSLDLATLSTKRLINHAVLMTGDSDMIPAIQIAKNEGVIVELFYVTRTTHHELLQAVDIATQIDQIFINQIKKA
ncbi:MAG: NYN domain-containing protein [Schwartzia sp.]|nr:NYN domain-containing protein [Schwartzia sp. (in: firmicutes)]